jgi:hypothetical protein
VGELIRYSPIAVAFALGLAMYGNGTASQSRKVSPVAEFQRAADSYAFVHRQAEREIGMAHRRAGLAIDQIASQALAERIVAKRAKDSKQVMFTPKVAAAFRERAARVARTPPCNPGELRSGAWITSYKANSPATGTKTISECIASALPSLPDELEYRSAGTVLVLVDWHANLVVDVLPALLIDNGHR